MNHARKIDLREPLPGVVYPPSERLSSYVKNGALPEVSLTEALIRSFEQHASRVAVCVPEGDVTYAQLDSISDRFAAGGERFYAFAGRTKDVVDRGSEKVNCEEVEIAFSTHAAVSVCAVVGMPDRMLGERICVYVVLKDGERAPSVVDM